MALPSSPPRPATEVRSTGRRVRVRLAELEAKVIENRMVLNDGHFFDTHGRRIEIEPVVDA